MVRPFRTSIQGGQLGPRSRSGSSSRLNYQKLLPRQRYEGGKCPPSPKLPGPTAIELAQRLKTALPAFAPPSPPLLNDKNHLLRPLLALISTSFSILGRMRLARRPNGVSSKLISIFDSDSFFSSNPAIVSSWEQLSMSAMIVPHLRPVLVKQSRHRCSKRTSRLVNHRKIQIRKEGRKKVVMWRSVGKRQFGVEQVSILDVVQ